MRNRYKLLFVITLCLFMGMTSVPAYTEPGRDALHNALVKDITRPDSIIQTLTLDWSYIERFYSVRRFAPVWTTLDGPNARASVLRQFLHVADQEGLSPQSFHLTAIDSSWYRRTPGELATLDILLSDAFFRYAAQVMRGRSLPMDVDPQWHVVAAELQPIAVLQKMLAGADFEAAMQALPPPQSGYRNLRAALARYRQLAKAGGWPLLPPGPTLREGMQHAQIRILRKRLLAEGDLHEDTPAMDPNRFDPAVKFAVDRFQVRHGLKMDGAVGPATRAAMNIPIAERITQIKLNMERWRWLPRQLGERYLIVNTAGYDLTAFDHDQAQFSMWVVIGKQDRQTPVIAGAMHTVVFNPYWTVPLTIVMEDLIPAQLRDPRYLRTRKVRVFANLRKQLEVDPRKVDWASYTRENFPYVLRQDPGPFNPLGRYKFLFSNEYDVYLHDTPARQLFSHKQRTFSSGCIRVENPLQLASFLLAANPAWDEARIKAAAASGQTSEVKLEKSLPIYLLYLTAWVGQAGTVQFYPDVYHRDPPLARCVSAGASSSDKDFMCLP
ncbi:MAG: L,D-transpeptidase family protein [Gammaproteobacteria bacterium]|nr:L,D-transpeptidase family protein [Gammaproteobacteria bacterium]